MADRFLVTGCASGIGLRVAEALVQRGHRVLATDIRHEAIDAGNWDRERVRTAALDVTKPDAWTRVLDEAWSAWGGLDVLYNIAGYLMPGWVQAIDLRDIDRHIDINTKGVMYGTHLCARRMIEQGSGHIVNIASMAAFAPVPGLALYCASKYAVRAFSLAAAVELRDHGVAVTVVCPDAVATPMLDKQKDYEEAAMTFTAPRVLSAEEVAAHLVGPVLERRPLETALPRSRKWLARVADMLPEVAIWARPLFQKQGRAAQARARRHS
ncbi:MAG TPA: SDR family oxidoreductase [Polyangiaceae bacterium]|jgi:3-oxoacyl-[acyl-carrier protein] reductase|nr:SDR family oxidoreductase [Polyangiaceae bacterium]